MKKSHLDLSKERWAKYYYKSFDHYITHQGGAMARNNIYSPGWASLN